jgi:hypothetical protein
VFLADVGAFGSHGVGQTTPLGKEESMLGIIAAVLFFIAFLINAADISTNDTFTSTNFMLIGLTLLALHVAGIGSAWASRSRRR